MQYLLDFQFIVISSFYPIYTTCYVLTPDFTIVDTSRRQILLEFKKEEIAYVHNETKTKHVCLRLQAVPDGQ